MSMVSSFVAEVGVGSACASFKQNSIPSQPLGLPCLAEAVRIPILIDTDLCLRRSSGEACARMPIGGVRFRAGLKWRGRCTGALLQSEHEHAVPQKQDTYVVGDFMTPRCDLFVARPSTTVDEALEVLVENRITGMPVVDENDKLVGVVSDYDLLALDSISGKRTANNGLFPEAGSTWKAFKEIQRLLTKTHGKTIEELMTPSPLVVREMTDLENAARLLLDSKYRRLPVVDNSGKLVGLLTRGNVVRAALHIKQSGGTK